VTEYGQFCALARAAELIGERWTLLILRELYLGPQRFSDLKQRLAPIAPGVLNGRLRALEGRGVIGRRDVPPPTPARVYELTDAGRGLQPALFELLRWGAHYLFPQRPGERFEPEWLRMVLEAYAATSPTPSISVEISVRDDAEQHRPMAVAVAVGGVTGTEIRPAGKAQAGISATPVALLGLMSARTSLAEAESQGQAVVTGDRAAAERLSSLFEAHR